MGKFSIVYTPKNCETKRFYFEGERDLVISSFNNFLKENLRDLLVDISLYEYMQIQDFNPILSMFGYVEIIRGEVK